MFRKKKISALTILLSTLLLTSMLLFGVVQSSSDSDSDDPWTAGSVGDEADAFFDDSYVHEIRLYFDDPDWYDTLYNGHANDPEDPYFPARFVYNDTVLDPVGVRFKGLSSFMGGLASFGSSGVKKSFRIDFNEYEEDDENATEKTFFGLKKLNLNNGFSDPTLLREKLFWDFASQYVTAIRAVHTRLYINDEYYGLYMAVEQIDHTFIESRFGNDEEGNLYKVESGSLSYLGSEVSAYNGSYELKTNKEENDWSDLINLTYILTNVSISDLPDQLESVFDVDTALYSLALLNIFSSLDSYISTGRNYYLYDQDGTGQFIFLLWDANMAFGGFGMGLSQGESGTTLDPFSISMSGGFGGNFTDGFEFPQNMTGRGFPGGFEFPQNMTDGGFPGGFGFPQNMTGIVPPDGFPQNMTGGGFPGGFGFPQNGTDIMPPGDFDFPQNITDGGFLGGFRQNRTAGNFLGGMGGGMFALGDKTLITNVMAVSSYNRTYLRAIAQMLREGFDADSITARIQELADLIRDDVYSDPNLLSSTEEFEAGLTKLVTFVGERAAYLNARLDEFAEKTDLQLNELMTVNHGTIMDAEGDYDPWVEIYNLGPGTVNTSNMFLTDDPEAPNKWELPAQDLNDGQFLLLWLDGETSEGTDHASFSLDSDGGEVYLYTYDGAGYELIDAVTYPALDADVSYCCSSDGDGLWHEMNDYSTPAAPNQVDDFHNYLVINEFMADNDITIAGPDGNSPDWIELFNAGDETIDLSGMYLTDDLTDPTCWQFPEDTYIEPGGYLLVWADRDGGDLYTSFGLNANGEEIGLFASDGETLIDSVVFVKQLRDVSYGRIPDGSANWDYLPTSTPGSANQDHSMRAESSVWSLCVILILFLVVSVSVVFVGKVSARMRQ